MDHKENTPLISDTTPLSIVNEPVLNNNIVKEENQNNENQTLNNEEEPNIRKSSPAILITNLAPNTTEKNLADFFSFCGKITSLSIRKKGNQTVSIVHFETEAAAKTALLLTNALINNQAIKVSLYGEEDKELHRIEEENSKSDVKVNFSDIEDTLEITDMPVDQIPVRDFSVPDEERSATSVIASMIGAGYGLGYDALSKAKQLDEQKIHLSEKLHAGTELIKTKVHQIDEQFHISEQASNLTKQISTSWNQFDTTYHISESTSNILQTVNQSVSQSLNTVRFPLNSIFRIIILLLLLLIIINEIMKALENPSVQNAVQSISLWGNNFGKNVSAFFEPASKVISQEFNQIKEESAKKIEEHKQHSNVNNNNNNNNYDIEPDTLEMKDLSQDISDEL